MKSIYHIIKIWIFALLLFGAYGLKVLAYTDTQSNVYTPRWSEVIAWITDESSTAIREGLDNYYSAAYPNANKIITYDGYSSTRRFNCHGYAWHIVEGGSDRWIGLDAYSTDEDVYMTDGSYVQVANEMYPGKVSWGSDDHSAITTSQSGIFISKWKDWPLMQHSKNDSPFGANDLKYYV